MARLILINGPPASGKSTLARRYVDDHERAALVEFDTLRMTLPNWEADEATRLVAQQLAGAEVVEHLGAGRDVVMPQYFGRLGHVNLLEGLAHEHHATFVEVILASGEALAIDRFRARRREMIESGVHHPERDIADADVEAFIVDAIERLTRLPTARPQSLIVPIGARRPRARSTAVCSPSSASSTSFGPCGGHGGHLAAHDLAVPAVGAAPVNERSQHNDESPVERRAVRTRSGSHTVRKHRTRRRPSRRAFVGVPQRHGRPGCAAHAPAPVRTRSSHPRGHARRRCSTSQQLRRCRRTAGQATLSVAPSDPARPRAQSGSLVVRDP